MGPALRTLASLVSMVTDLVGVLVTGAGVLAAIIGAWLGFKAWRRELRGTTSYHAARRVLQAVYRLRDGLVRTRMPGDPTDPRGRPIGEDENARLFRLRNLEWAYDGRIGALAADYQELMVAEQEALALLGRDAGRPLEGLHTITANLIQSAERYFHSEHQRGYGLRVHRAGGAVDIPPDPRSPEMERIRALLYRQQPHDWFDQQVESAVEIAEAWYRPRLR
jgi:hypothetical protein